MWLEIIFFSHRPLLLGCCYRPNNSTIAFLEKIGNIPWKCDRQIHIYWLETLKRQCHDNPWFLAAILCWENNGGHKARPQKTTISQGKQHFLDSAWAVKLFARPSKLSWSDVLDTLRKESALFPRANKAQKNHWLSWHHVFNLKNSDRFSRQHEFKRLTPERTYGPVWQVSTLWRGDTPELCGEAHYS